MYEDFLGSIKIFAGSYAPKNWAFCNGQLLLISEYEALFSILETRYGGDGHTTFGLPDFRGRLSVGASAEIPLASMGGAETHTLTVAEIPAHRHNISVSSNRVRVSAENATQATITTGSSLAAPVESRGRMKVSTEGFTNSSSSIALNNKTIDIGDLTLQNAGEGIPHENRMPSLGMSYVICIEGIYPFRS